MADLIGRTEYLRDPAGRDPQAAQARSEARCCRMPAWCPIGRSSASHPSNAPFDKGELAERMVADMLPAIEQRSPAASGTTRSRTSTARSARACRARSRGAGATTAWRRRRWWCICRGSIGQSFGVWNAGGLHLYLEGDANDYVGKGMAGGPHRAQAAQGRELRGARHHHHGQHLPVRRHRRAAVCGRPGRRALRGAQLRRGRGDRGRRRSLLRVHDRRRGVRARAHRA